MDAHIIWPVPSRSRGNCIVDASGPEEVELEVFMDGPIALRSGFWDGGYSGWKCGRSSVSCSPSSIGFSFFGKG